MGNRSINTLSKLPFEKIIGGPLVAAVKAQAMSASTTVEFIKAVGFTPPKNKTDEDVAVPIIAPSKDEQDFEVGDVRYVTFQYGKRNSDGTSAEGKIKVPILTILPIPMLRIEEMTIDFGVKMTESTESSTETSSERKNQSQYGIKMGISSPGFSLSASYSGSSYSHSKSSAKTASKYSMDTSLDIHVRAVGDELPSGLGRILGILEANMIDEHKDVGSPAEIPMWKAGKQYSKGDVVYALGNNGEAIEYASLKDNSDHLTITGSWAKAKNLST